MLKTLLLVVTLVGWGVADARDYADQQADSSQYWPGWSGKQMQMTNDIFQPIVDSSDYDPFFFHSFVHPYFKK